MNDCKLKIANCKLQIVSAAVVAPGPSGVDYPGYVAGGHDVVIGVNRAVLWTECDYWSCADRHTFGMVEDGGGAIGIPTIVCRRGIFDTMTEKYPAARQYEHLDVRLVKLEGCHGAHDSFSSLVGILVAVHLGATHVDCYGMDLAGVEDADGFTHGCQNRDDGRWAKEAFRLADLITVLADRGVTVNRITRPQLAHADCTGD